MVCRLVCDASKQPRAHRPKRVCRPLLLFMSSGLPGTASSEVLDRVAVNALTRFRGLSEYLVVLRSLLRITVGASLALIRAATRVAVVLRAASTLIYQFPESTARRGREAIGTDLECAHRSSSIQRTWPGSQAGTLPTKRKTRKGRRTAFVCAAGSFTTPFPTTRVAIRSTLGSPDASGGCDQWVRFSDARGRRSQVNRLIRKATGTTNG
jgi:hypothetical protein